MEYGYLKVNVSTAGGALPVEGADVTVTGGPDTGGGILYVVKTDSSGTIPPIPLEAPPRSLSEQSGNKDVFAVYNIIVDKTGYRRVEDFSVPIFSGITSIQPVDLVPLPFGSSNGDGQIDIYSEENGYDL